MKEYTPFLHIKLLNELNFLELEIEKTGEILSVSVSKSEAKKALIDHRKKIDKYKKKNIILDEIINEEY
tara:strand:+ start:2253 stop:2459 length:207 start_codon:yes stop_codon:yes gene_type:complete